MTFNRFRIENKDYIVALQDDNSVVFYREELDEFNWFGGPYKILTETDDIKRPISLLRLVASKIRHDLYKNKIKYFSLKVSNDKLQRIALNFLNTLPDYEYHVSKDTFNVFRKSNEDNIKG